jgi:hypothetical protein
MTMQGKRLGATLRVDLPGGGGGGPDWSGTPGPTAFARSVASYLTADAEADGSLLALFTETDGDGAPWAELLAALEDTLADAGMPVRDAWLVGAEYWRNAYCLDPSCCAPPGRPVEEIRNSRLNAEMVYRGSTVGAAPGAALLTPPPGPPDPAVLEAQRDWAQLFAARVRDRRQFGQVLDVWARVLQAHAPTLSTALSGYLRASLCVPPWRDAVLVMAAAGPEAAERGAEDFGVFHSGAPEPGAGGSRPACAPAFLPLAPLPPLDGFPPRGLAPRRVGLSRGEGTRGEGTKGEGTRGEEDFRGEGPSEAGGRRDGSDRGRGRGRGGGGSGGGGSGSGYERTEVPGYGEVLLGVAPPLPDWALMGRLDRVLEQLCAAGGEAGAAALTGRGWIEWCRGKGSFADALFRRADQELPGYRLAQLLAELVRRGTLCGWAARREAAWQRFEPDVA